MKGAAEHLISQDGQRMPHPQLYSTSILAPLFTFPQGSDGKWNKFGGRLAWDASVICCNNPQVWPKKGGGQEGKDYRSDARGEGPQVSDPEWGSEGIRNGDMGGSGLGIWGDTCR